MVFLKIWKRVFSSSSSSSKQHWWVKTNLFFMNQLISRMIPLQHRLSWRCWEERSISQRKLSPSALRRNPSIVREHSRVSFNSQLAEAKGETKSWKIFQIIPFFRHNQRVADLNSIEKWKTKLISGKLTRSKRLAILNEVKVSFSFIAGGKIWVKYATIIPGHSWEAQYTIRSEVPPVRLGYQARDEAQMERWTS